MAKEKAIVNGFLIYRGNAFALSSVVGMALECYNYGYPSTDFTDEEVSHLPYVELYFSNYRPGLTGGFSSTGIKYYRLLIEQGSVAKEIRKYFGYKLKGLRSDEVDFTQDEKKDKYYPLRDKDIRREMDEYLDSLI